MVQQQKERGLTPTIPVTLEPTPTRPTKLERHRKVHLLETVEVLSVSFLASACHLVHVLAVTILGQVSAQVAVYQKSISSKRRSTCSPPLSWAKYRRVTRWRLSTMNTISTTPPPKFTIRMILLTTLIKVVNTSRLLLQSHSFPTRLMKTKLLSSTDMNGGPIPVIGLKGTSLGSVMAKRHGPCPQLLSVLILTLILVLV